MAEHIPLDPFEPHTEEHTDEHEHETSFGGHDNTGFDPDDYDTDAQRRNARVAIEVLRKNGLPAPSDVFYFINNKETLISADKENWYAIKFGKSVDGEEIVGLIPIGSAPDPPDTLKMKFDLQVDQGDDDETTPLIGHQMLEDLEREREESEQFLKSVFYKPSLEQVFHGKDPFGNTWVSLKAKNSSKFVVNDNGTLTRLDGKRGKPSNGLLNMLGKTAVEVLRENQDQINKNAERQEKIREEEAKVMKERHDSLLNEMTRMERGKQELESQVSELKSRQNQIDAELTRGREEYKKMKRLIISKGAEMKRMRDKLSEMEEGNTDIVRIINFKKEIDQYEASIDAFVERVKEKEEENDRLSKELEEFHKANDGIIQSLEERSAKIELDMTDMREMANQTQDYIEKHRGMLQGAKKQVEIEKAVTDRVRRQLKEANDKLSESTSPAERNRLEREVAELQRRLAESNERSSKLQSDLTEIRQREEESERLSEENEEIEEENEGILSRMNLKERVKAIFRKYGVTIIGILAAAGSVIATIVTNLTSGLQKLAKGVGEGFKEIGAKLGQILPGMIGAIVSFLFKAAGEAVSFLAKNSWLLILLVVTFAVDQFKVSRGSAPRTPK